MAQEKKYKNYIEKLIDIYGPSVKLNSTCNSLDKLNLRNYEEYKNKIEEEYKNDSDNYIYQMVLSAFKKFDDYKEFEHLKGFDDIDKIEEEFNRMKNRLKSELSNKIIINLRHYPIFSKLFYNYLNNMYIKEEDLEKIYDLEIYNDIDMDELLFAIYDFNLGVVESLQKRNDKRERNLLKEISKRKLQQVQNENTKKNESKKAQKNENFVRKEEEKVLTIPEMIDSINVNLGVLETEFKRIINKLNYNVDYINDVDIVSIDDFKNRDWKDAKKTLHKRGYKAFIDGDSSFFEELVGIEKTKVLLAYIYAIRNDLYNYLNDMFENYNIPYNDIDEFISLDKDELISYIYNNELSSDELKKVIEEVYNYTKYVTSSLLDMIGMIQTKRQKNNDGSIDDEKEEIEAEADQLYVYHFAFAPGALDLIYDVFEFGKERNAFNALEDFVKLFPKKAGDQFSSHHKSFHRLNGAQSKDAKGIKGYRFSDILYYRITYFVYQNTVYIHNIVPQSKKSSEYNSMMQYFTDLGQSHKHKINALMSNIELSEKHTLDNVLKLIECIKHYGFSKDRLMLEKIFLNIDKILLSNNIEEAIKSLNSDIK